MKNHLSLCLVLCFIQLGTLSNSHAQEKNEDNNGSRFRVTLFNKWEGPELYIKTKKSYMLLEAHKMAYTKSFRYSAGQPIVLYTKLLTEKGDEKYVPFIRFPVANTILEPLLVLHWQSKGGKVGGKVSGKVSGKVLEFSARRFGYGSYQLVNLSSTKILGYIGDKKKLFFCDPKSEYISHFTLKNGVRTPIVVYTPNGTQPDLVFSTLTIHREKKRVILFLNAETNKLGRLVYRAQSLVDFKNEDK